MKYEDCKKNVMAVLEFAKANGYRCYFVDAKRICSAYGYMITPKGNVMYVQTGDWGGWQFGIQYVPSRQTGTGCTCFEDTVFEVDLDTLERAENEGLAFAKKIKAKHYSSPEEWLSNVWNRSRLVEI